MAEVEMIVYSKRNLTFKVNASSPTHFFIKPILSTFVAFFIKLIFIPLVYSSCLHLFFFLSHLAFGALYDVPSSSVTSCICFGHHVAEWVPFKSRHRFICRYMKVAVTLYVDM